MQEVIDGLSNVFIVGIMSLLAFLPFLAIFWLVVGSGRALTRMNAKRHAKHK